MIDERILPDTEAYIEILFHWHRYSVATELAKGKRVVDLASGEGYGSHLISSKALEVTGIDVDPRAVENAQRSYQRDNLSYRHGSATMIPMPDASCDLLVSFETIEHMPEADQEVFLKEIKRTLKPEGMLLISTPDKHRTELWEEKNPFHIREYYQEEFVEALKKQYRYVEVYLQEVNMASWIWQPLNAERSSQLRDFRLKHGPEGYRRTEDMLGIHLYVLALCSDEPIPEGLNLASTCHEVARRPLELMWREQGLLGAEIARVKAEIASLKEQNQALENGLLVATSTLRSIYDSMGWKLLESSRRAVDLPLVRALLRPLRQAAKGYLRRERP